jgi:hypothetical protein
MADFPAETDYEVVALEDGSFEVRISSVSALPRVVAGFATQEEAEAWVFQQIELPTGNQGLPRHI